MIQNNLLLAIVGMPGAGKSETVAYLQKKGIPVVRFGELTDEEVQKAGLPLTQENEKKIREKLREELGMAAYAIKAEPKIQALTTSHPIVALDGLYSWEEYTYLKERFPSLILIHIYADPALRYERLSKREIRPLTPIDARKRDIAELEALHKGGPIAIADYLIENNADFSTLHEKVDILLKRLGVNPQ